MASRKRTATAPVLPADFSPATADALLAERKRTGTLPVWAGWTPELRAQAATLAASVCAAKAHKHEGYDSCMGCRIGAKAFTRVVNGGPTSAEVRATKAAKLAAKAPEQVAAVASVPVAAASAPAAAAARIGFRPRGKKQAPVAAPALTEPGETHQAGVRGLSAKQITDGIARLVEEAKRRGMA